MSLKLEVGKTYLDGMGRVIKIINYWVLENIYESDRNAVCYTVTGRLYGPALPGPYDLFTEHNPEDL